MFAFLSASAQSSHEIKFDIKNYENDTLIVGNYFGNRQIVVDTLIAKKKGKFVLSGEDALKPGMYLALIRPSNNYAQFIVASNEQKFTIKLDADNFSDISFKGSQENENFYTYLDYLGKQKEKAEALTKKLEEAKEKGVEDAKAQAEFDKLDEAVTAEQMRIVKANPNAVFSKLINGNLPIDIPEYEGEDSDVQMKRYLYYRDHYFDHIDLGDSTHLRMPYLHQKVTYFMENLTPLNPDSMVKSVDYLLEKMEPAEETYRFYVSYLYNDIVKKRLIGMDKVVVHMVDKYYANGKAPWVSEESMSKITDNANRIRPTLIGQKAKNVTLYQEDGTPWELYKDTSEYIVLVFWAPDCGHCTKAMPKYLEFAEKFQDRGVKMVGVCNKTGKKFDTCWPAVKEKKMEGILNVADQYMKSRFKVKYDVRQTPKLFILDKNKEIVLKDVPAESLEELMEEVIKNHKAEEGQ